MATPIDDASNRCGSRVEFSATTANTTSPGFRYFTPSLRASILQLGGKIEETRTRFCAAIPASRSANSKEVNRSRCFPTPLVKNIRLGTMSLPNSVASGKKIYDIGNAQFNTMVCKQTVNLSREQKKWEAAGAGSHFVPGPVWGRAPGKTRLNVTQRKGNCAKDFFSLGFPNNPTQPSPLQWPISRLRN